MDTFLTNSPEIAAEFIRNGGLVAFPTETVYGLGARVFDEAAVAKIFEAKQRPADNPLIAHVADLEQISELTSEITESATKFIDKFFPGPLTLVLEKSPRVPSLATAGLDTIGVRMPESAAAREFLNACQSPVVAPSANLSGRPSPTTWQAVYEDLNGRIDCILQGDPADIGVESTVVDCTGEIPIILREGAISLEELQTVVPATARAPVRDPKLARSPGLKYRHYSPRAKVTVVETEGQVETTENAAFIGLRLPQKEPRLVKLCDDAEEYAHELFEFLRECDRRGIDTVYCQAVDEQGIGAALMDRLRRAAQG